MEKIMLYYRNPKTLRLIPRRDLFFAKQHYDKLRDFILSMLLLHHTISLAELMDEAKEIDPSELATDNVIVPLLLVKSDLEARGVIKVSFEVHHTQRIELKNKSHRYLKQLRNSIAHFHEPYV